MENMLTISKALGSAQALEYFEEQYSNARENYYTQGDSIKGQWVGKLADELGLKGEVDREQISRLVEGQDPRTGKQLIKHVKPYTYTNKFGEEVTTRGHRAGWDLTFSAPKSVSLAALVGGDERLKEAHRKAVETALTEMEKYVQARMGGDNPAATTGRMLTALFEHDTSRPDSNGLAAAQLHTHALTFNLTMLENGKWRSLQPAELFAGQRYGTAIYRSVLASEAQKLGYEIEIDRKTGAPEISGFSQAYLDVHSQRSKEVRQEAREMKARLEAAGFQVSDGAGLRQAAATANRRSKKFDRAEMLDRHQELDREHGHEAHNAVDRARARGPIEYKQEEIEKRAREAVTFGRDHVIEREAVADRRDLITHSLRRNMGLTTDTYPAVKQEIARREASGEIIRIEGENKMPSITTQYMLDLERGLIDKMKAGKGTQQAAFEGDRVKEEVKRIADQLGIKLNESQEKAVTELLTSRDQITGLQGKAGTGKTTVLSVVKTALEERGYEVSGFAPTTRAASLLSDADIHSTTLQMFLHSKEQETPNPRAFILDESSLTGSEDMRQFFDRLRPRDRVILVGDDRQHQAISAGAPFEHLQSEGMSTSRLEKILRQKDAGLLEAVENISEKKIREGVKLLISQGRVTEIEKDLDRLTTIAGRYCAAGNALVLSPANADRIALNTLIHRQLQHEGKISGEDHQTMVYRPRQEMTGAERTFAGAYQTGDIVRYTEGSRVYGLKRGEYARVVGGDFKNNTVTVETADGRQVTYDPRRLSGVSVYTEADRAFSVGDNIQFCAPFKEGNVANGEFATIKSIDGKDWRLQLENGKEVKLDINAFRHLDHGYAVTSYKSQGQTIDVVLINANTREAPQLLNQRMAYVAVSRARHEAHIYTDSIEDLGPALDRAQDKKIGIKEWLQSLSWNRDKSHKQQERSHERTHIHGLEYDR